MELIVFAILIVSFGIQNLSLRFEVVSCDFDYEGAGCVLSLGLSNGFK